MPRIHPLSVRSVSRSFSGLKVIETASLELEPGQITALVGPSGSGKTTLLRMIAGMERPDAGQILSGDQVLADGAKIVPIEKRNIGLVFQDFALFPHLNVVENVMFGLRKHSKSERLEIADHWLSQLGLSQRRNAFPHHLSGGEQQRTAIARALAPEPVAILLDEPFSGLDPSMREQVRQVALDAVRSAGIPALLVTHDAHEALAHADQIAVIEKGVIQQTGLPETVYRNPVSEVVARALGPVYELAIESLPDECQKRLSVSAPQVFYRPEAWTISAGDVLEVESVKFAGAQTRLILKTQNGDRIHAIAPTNMPLGAGDRVKATLDPDYCYTFLNDVT